MSSLTRRSRLVPPFAVGVILVALWATTDRAESTFTTFGLTWAVNTASWRANNNFPLSAGTLAQQLTALQAGAANWTTQTCADFSFNYLGTTTITTTGVDGTSAVFYGGGTSPTAIAVTSIFGFGTTITEFDMRFHTNWSYDAVFPSASEFDIQGIATHEFGHALGLDHDTCNVNATMWPSVSQGVPSFNLRTLEVDDVAGCLALYGLLAPSPNPMTFAAAPANTVTGSASMTATTATACNGHAVNYLFTLVSSNGTGGTTSAWQASPIYVDSGLSPNGVFTYNARARDVVTLAEGTPSSNASIISLAATPGLVTVNNVLQGGFNIASVAANGNPTITTFAIDVNGSFVTATGTLSAAPTWRTAAQWVNRTVTGLIPDTVYTVSAKARNLFNVETPLGPATQVRTLLLSTCATGNVPNGSGGFANILTINGSSGVATNRRVQVPVGQPFSFTVTQPPTNPFPADFALLAWFGIPPTSVAFPIPGVGTLCFIPCDVAPGGSAFNIASTFPTACGELVGATPATWTLAIPSLPFPIFDLTMQAVIFTAPGVLGVSNAVVFLYL